ncbi:hypothetical protein GG344DRAFT_61737 [Lentinula edodes]|nr:hypothetical protein GG344DRAFT_61737 [Lentinula edodes]
MFSRKEQVVSDTVRDREALAAVLCSPLGILVAALLLGVSVIQMLYYVSGSGQKDGLILRTLVGIVFTFDVVHQGLITHTGYIYLISYWQHPTKIHTVVWSLLIEVLFNGLVAFCIQCLWAYRIWKLGGKVWIVSVVLASLEFSHQSYRFQILTPCRLLRVRTLEELTTELKGLSVAVNALAVASDLLIAGTLTFMFQHCKTGFKRSDTMLNKLIFLVINTGAVTSLCAVASLVSILAAPNSFIYISFFFSMGRLYMNALLMSLNARGIISEAGNMNTMNCVNTDITMLVFNQSTTVNVSAQAGPISDL